MSSSAVKRELISKGNVERKSSKGSHGPHQTATGPLQSISHSSVESRLKAWRSSERGFANVL